MKTAWIVLGAAVVLVAPFAWASLEQGAAPAQAARSVSSSGVASPARVVARSMPQNLQVRQVTGPHGVVVQEYIGADGALFAMTWAGKQAIDARTLVAGYFPQAHVGTHAAHGLQLVLHSSVQPWGSEGVAYVPALMPLDFDPNTLAP